MTFSGFSLQESFSLPSIDFGSSKPSTIFGLDSDFSSPWSNSFAYNLPPLDFSAIKGTTIFPFGQQQQQQSTNLFSGLLKDIFDLPSILSIGKGIMDATVATSAYRTAAAEQDRQNAAAQQEYWTRYADQVAQNYREYQYQLETYYRDLDYVQKRRDYEEQLAKQQAEYKGAVATQAFKNFERQIADLEGRFYEEEAKETIEIENIRAKTIAEAASTKARGQVGRSVERLTNQYHQQYLANLSNRQITRNYRIADKIRQSEALEVARQNTVNEVQFYTPQPIADPVKPIAPLPITAVPPTPGSGPSQTALTIELGNIAIDALKNYESMQPPAPTSKPAA